MNLRSRRNRIHSTRKNRNLNRLSHLNRLMNRLLPLLLTKARQVLGNCWTNSKAGSSLWKRNWLTQNPASRTRNNSNRSTNESKLPRNVETNSSRKSFITTTQSPRSSKPNMKNHIRKRGPRRCRNWESLRSYLRTVLRRGRRPLKTSRSEERRV